MNNRPLREHSDSRYGDLDYNAGGRYWRPLHPGTSGQFLKTQGKDQPPLWASVPVSGLGVCYDAIVDPSGTYGTHTTIQAALNAVQNIQDGRLLVFGGSNYVENLVPPAGTATHLNIDGCPPHWNRQWTSTSNPAIAVNVVPASGVALDLLTATAVKIDISGIAFAGVSGSPTIRIRPDQDLMLDGCKVQSNSLTDSAIHCTGAAGSGNSTVEIIRSYIAGLGTNTACIDSVTTGGPTYYCRESVFEGYIALSTLGYFDARECRFDFVGTNGVTGSGGVFDDCIFNHGSTSPCKAIVLRKNLGVDSFFGIHDCQFYNFEFSNGETAIDLSTAGGNFYGSLGGNYFSAAGGGVDWNIGVLLGANVHVTTYPNVWTGTTTPISGGTADAISSYESRQAFVAANFANPSASVGLTAVNGAALTAMRSDGAPPIDQGIAPTWTGIHLASAAYRNSAYGRFGATAAPTNVTAGDLTAIRANIGNVAFASGCVVEASGGDYDAVTGQGYRINGTATTGHVLRGNGTRFVDAAPRNEDLTTAYRFRAHASGVQVVGTGAFVVVKLDAKDYDPNTNFDATTNYTYTAPVTGYYQFNGSVVFNSALAAVNTLYLLSLFKNGVEIVRGQWFTVEVVGLTFSGGLGLASQEFLTAGDTVDLRVFQSSAGNQNFGAAATPIYNIFSGHILST